MPRNDFYFAFPDALVRQPTDELFSFFHTFLGPGLAPGLKEQNGARKSNQAG